MADRLKSHVPKSDVPLTAETDLDALFTAILGRDADGALLHRADVATSEPPSVAPPVVAPRPGRAPLVLLPPAPPASAPAPVDAPLSTAAAGADLASSPSVPESPLAVEADERSDSSEGSAQPPWRTVASSPWTVVALAAIAIGTLGLIVRSVGGGDDAAAPPPIVAQQNGATPAAPVDGMTAAPTVTAGSAMSPAAAVVTPASSASAGPPPAAGGASRSTAALPPRPVAAVPPRPAATAPSSSPLGTTVAAGVIVAAPPVVAAPTDGRPVTPPVEPTAEPAGLPQAPGGSASERTPDAVGSTTVAVPVAAAPPLSPATAEAAPAVSSPARDAQPSAAIAPPSPARPAGVTRPARIVERPSVSLRNVGPPGEVTVQITVEASGLVSAVRSLAGPMSLRPAAEAAARQTRFEPAMRAGVPVASLVTVVYAVGAR